MSKKRCPREVINFTLDKLRADSQKRINLIWLEACGCSGNIISLLNTENPDIPYLLTQMVNLTFNNSTMGSDGDKAFEKFLGTLDTEFILVVEGAVTSKDNGIYNIIASYNGKQISGSEAIKLAAGKAKYIMAVGTCASHGGTSAGKPNPAQCMSVEEFLQQKVVKVPGCPANPQWVVSTIAHLISFGMPELDEDGRPRFLYGETIHTFCSRRSFFDKDIFATKLGDKECMFNLGCRGPITKTNCPINKWNGHVNWPVQDNTPCIGCSNKGFPDVMEPFIKF